MYANTSMNIHKEEGCSVWFKIKLKYLFKIYLKFLTNSLKYTNKNISLDNIILIKLSTWYKQIINKIAQKYKIK